MTPRPSGTCDMPCWTTSSGRMPATSLPSTRTRPAFGFTSPDSVRSSDDLPAPLAPRTAVMLPAATSIVTPSRAVTAPYDVTRSCTCSVAPRVVSRSDIGRLRDRVGGLVDLVTEVRGEDALVGPDLGRRAGRDRLPEVEYDDAVAHAHHEVHVVLDEHHRHPPAQAADEVAELVHVAVRQARRRLVQQQD